MKSPHVTELLTLVFVSVTVGLHSQDFESLRPETVHSLLKLESLTATMPSRPEIAADRAVVNWQVVERNRDSETWSAVPTAGASRSDSRRADFVIVGTGMNYKDPSGQWQKTRAEFEITPDGHAVAQFGPHKLIVENNINSPTAIDFLTEDGVRLRSAPLAIGYYDPVDGRNVTIATARDTAGALTGPAEITFRSAFNGLDASVRITYRRAGMSADLLLHEAPPDPLLLGLSPHARLELYTEFSADSPLPTQMPMVLREGKDPLVRQLMLEADFVDHVLDYGAYEMGVGEAFEMNGGARLVVAKRFMVLADGRKILAEAVEHRDASKLFASLPKFKDVARIAQLRQPANNSEILLVGGGELSLPTRQNTGSIKEPIEQLIADSRPPKPTFVLDYTIVTGTTNMLFVGGVTYAVISDTFLYGHTVFEPACLKYTNAPGVGLRIRGTVETLTSPYAPLICTSQNDNTQGETLPWSSGNPSTNFYADPAIDLAYTTAPATFQHLRISHARVAVKLTAAYNPNYPTFAHAQFIRCGDVFNLNYGDPWIRNCLVYQSSNVIYGGFSNVRAEHLTAHQADALGRTNQNALFLSMTNSFVALMTNMMEFTGANNAVTNSSSFFTAAGAGAHYLTNTYPPAGTANINPGLLSDLRQRTTRPPLIMTNGYVVVDTTLNPVISRDTNSAPTIGYHYPAIDYIFGMVLITNAKLTLNPAVVLATATPLYGSYGFLLMDGSKLAVEGGPTNLARMVRNTVAQEQVNDPWPHRGPIIHFPWWAANPQPSATIRFAEISSQGDEVLRGQYGTNPVSLADCQFRPGVILQVPEGIMGMTNNLWERFYLTILGGGYGVTAHFRNNLFRGGTLDLWDFGASGTIRDNLFDRTAILYYSEITNSHNGYITGSNRLFPTNANDKVVSDFSYQTGPLSRYYISNSALHNVGSRSAADAGLWHYTVTTNQVRETNSTVDLGWHVMALSTPGNELRDTDSDYVVDYQEDVNGNGIQDGSEFSHTVVDTNNDGDGLSNYQEFVLGYSPVKVDTDGNRVADGDEDLDNELLSNAAEYNSYGSDPRNPKTMHTVTTDAEWFLAGVHQCNDPSLPARLIGCDVNPCNPFYQGQICLQLVGGTGAYDLYFIVNFPAKRLSWSMYALGPTTRPDPNQPILFQQIDPGTPTGFWIAGLSRQANGQISDRDGDGLDDGFEIIVNASKPDVPDSDGDGNWDGQDAFPRDGAASADTDEDGKPDEFHPNQSSDQLTVDDDDDNDAIPDSIENQRGSDSKNPFSLPVKWYVSAAAVPPPGTRDGSKDLPFANIQAALNAAAGDSDLYQVIQVDGGTYSGSGNINLLIGNKSIWLVALRGTENTIIDATAAASAITFQNDGGAKSWLIGFTIRNATGNAISCVNASPMLVGCVLTNNGVSPNSGRGIYLNNSSAAILNCTVLNNGNAASGSGLYCEGNGTVAISHCSFWGNSGSPQLYFAGTSKTLMNNGLVWSANANPEITVVSPAVLTNTHCNVEGGWSGPGLFNFTLNPAPIEPSARLLHGSLVKDRGNDRSMPLYNYIASGTGFGLKDYQIFVSHDRDREARLRDATGQLPFRAGDIGSDEFVYRLPFPVGADGFSRVDEASGVVYLGTVGSNPRIAIIDDELRASFYVYELDSSGSSIVAETAVPIGSDEENEFEIHDLEGITYDEANRYLYLLTSQTKRNRYRDVDDDPDGIRGNAPTDAVTDPPSNDYDKRRSQVIRIEFDANLAPISAAYWESDYVFRPYNAGYNANNGLIARIRTQLDAIGSPFRDINFGNRVLIAFNTVNKFGVPQNGTHYAPNDALPYADGGPSTTAGTVLGEFNPGTPSSYYTHTGRTPNTWYYYKAWALDSSANYSPGYHSLFFSSNRTDNVPDLRINEIQYYSSTDTIEIFNPAPVEHDLFATPIVVTDGGSANLWSVGSGTIPARGFLTVTPSPWGWSDDGSETAILRWYESGTPRTIDTLRLVPAINNATAGRAWDGGPRGRNFLFGAPSGDDLSCDFERNVGSPYPDTLGASNDTGPVKLLEAVADVNQTTMYVTWANIGLIPAVWKHSPKQHDNHPINVEAIAYRSSGEMIIGLRSPLKGQLAGTGARDALLNRMTGKALYFRVTDLGQFLPAGGWTPAAQAGVEQSVQGPFELDLEGRGFRSIEWCPQLGPGGAGRYLIISGPANGGPLEKEKVGEIYALWSWDGGSNLAKLIPDLQPYAIRPEGVDLILVNGEWRVMFVEDRFMATRYGTRNATHWPLSILGNVP